MGGGGGKTPKCTDKNNICTYIERAPQKHIFPGLKIHLHIQCHIQSMRFPLITYGMALYTHYTDKTLKLRKIYEYASERSERS